MSESDWIIEAIRMARTAHTYHGQAKFGGRAVMEWE